MTKNGFENVSNDVAAGCVEEPYQTEKYISVDYSPETLKKIENVMKEVDEISSSKVKDVVIFLQQFLLVFALSCFN